MKQIKIFFSVTGNTAVCTGPQAWIGKLTSFFEENGIDYEITSVKEAVKKEDGHEG